MNADVFHYQRIRKSYKKRKNHELSVEEMVDIVYSVVVEKDHHSDVADAFGVDVTLIHRLVRKARLDPLYLRKKLTL